MLVSTVFGLGLPPLFDTSRPEYGVAFHRLSAQRGIYSPTRATRMASKGFRRRNGRLAYRTSQPGWLAWLRHLL